MANRKPNKLKPKQAPRRRVSANSVNLFNAILWGVGGALYLLATNMWEDGIGIFAIFGYLFLLMAAMYAVRYLNNRK